MFEPINDVTGNTGNNCTLVVVTVSYIMTTFIEHTTLNKLTGSQRAITSCFQEETITWCIRQE